MLGAPSGANAGGPEARAADNFVIAPCDGRPICYIQAWIWSNCQIPRPFLEIYADNCGQPGTLPCVVPTTTTPIATDTGITATLNGKVFKLFSVTQYFPSTNPLVLPSGTYWLSAGADGTGSINEQSFFAERLPSCLNPTCDIKITPGEQRPVSATFVPPPSPPDLWTSLGYDLAFNISLADKPLATDGGSGESSPAPPAPPTTTCPGDFNRDGHLTVQDIFDFLRAWFTRCM